MAFPPTSVNELISATFSHEFANALGCRVNTKSTVVLAPGAKGPGIVLVIKGAEPAHPLLDANANPAGT